MLSYSEFQKGVKIILDDQPYEIIEASFLSKGRGSSVLQAKLKNLISGNIVSRTFHPSDAFEETELEKKYDDWPTCPKCGSDNILRPRKRTWTKMN